MSDLPSSSDDYAATDATPLSKAVWNAVFGSIGARLRALEAVEASFQALIDLGTTQALASIAANIEPELAAARATLQTFMAEAAAAEDVVAAIANGTLPASAVMETATRIWLTPTLRDLWNARQPGDPTLTALAAVDVAADRLIYATGADAFATTTLTAFARTLLAKVDAAAMREVIGAADADATAEALALRLRLDAEMTTTEAQRAQGRSTLGLGSAALKEAATTGAGTVVVRGADGVLIEARWDLVAEDRKASGTAAGQFSAAATDVTRTLNALIKNTLGATLAANHVTLPAGVYEIEWDAPAHRTGLHRTRLYNVTAAAAIDYGVVAYAPVGTDADSRSGGRVEVAFAAQTTVRVEHWATSASDVNSLGTSLPSGGNDGGPEIYARLRVKRIG